MVEPGNAEQPARGGGGWLVQGTAILLILGVILSALIVRPFLPALVWALSLATITVPVERSLRRRLHRPWLSTTLTLLLAIFVIVIPIILVAQSLVAEMLRNSDLISRLLSRDHWLQFARLHPWLGARMDQLTLGLEVDAMLRSLSSHLTTWSASLIQGSVSSLATLLLTFYFLFYFLRDGRKLLQAVGDVLPLAADEFSLLSARIKGAIMASVYGTVAVAALQGALGGLMFWWLGLPSPVFWAVIMGLLAIVPFLGAFVVWAPVAAGLALKGDFASAALLTAWGLLVVGLIDNLVYPILVGRQIAMHSMVSFIAIVGGVFVFGAYGVVFGPISVTATITLYRILKARRRAEAD